MRTDWAAIVTMIILWVFAQGGFGYIAALASEIFNGKLFPKLSKGVKIFIVVVVCLLLSFMEAVQTKLISLPINGTDAVKLIGLCMLIVTGSQIWWKNIINKKDPTQIESKDVKTFTK